MLMFHGQNKITMAMCIMKLLTVFVILPLPLFSSTASMCTQRVLLVSPGKSQTIL